MIAVTDPKPAERTEAAGKTATRTAIEARAAMRPPLRVQPRPRLRRIRHRVTGRFVKAVVVASSVGVVTNPASKADRIAMTARRGRVANRSENRRAALATIVPAPMKRDRPARKTALIPTIRSLRR